ncbi:hypothetical protein ACQPYA_13900 [Micromonospora sp. CA-263727]|uniref:hypothetical protein n=1 Tax=Micromonospora sp. CA-263727 TaxID=3239967 RepID=UPI003D900801
MSFFFTLHSKIIGFLVDGLRGVSACEVEIEVQRSWWWMVVGPLVAAWVVLGKGWNKVMGMVAVS